MKQKIIAVVNQKGGVGKTTTTVNVAAQLAANGASVLLVDFDPQGNSSSGLGVQVPPDSPTTYDLLCQGASLAETVHETNVPNLYIVPANANLAGAEVSLAAELAREYKLRDALKMASHEYIFIDCPPSLGLLTVNALAAADSLLIPVQAEYYALEGLSQLLTTVQRVRQGINPSLDILGVVVTMYDKRTTLSDQVLKELTNYFGDKLFKTIIPRNIRLAEAPSFGKTIFAHDKWSKGARAYKALASEVLKRLQ